MKEIVETLDSIDQRLDSIDMTLVKQEANLEEHMRRTEQVEKALSPVVKYVEQIKGAGKLLGIIALISGIIGLIVRSI